jgi:hypothetical protein
MLTKHFYSTIDSELGTLVEKYKNDDFIKKHNGRISEQTKSYALLIWFLDFYGRKSNYIDFITDGVDDSSCDIVFDNTNNQGEKIFYIVQSKWNNENNSEKETDRDEILKALNEFETLLRGEKQNVNEKLKVKLEELDNYLKANGEVKFIFLTLSQYKGGADENINSFINKDEKTKFEVIDINRIKTDYIDRFYKKIEPLNPLESYQNPEESPVTLDIVQKNGSIKIEKPFEAYMFLLRPKSIYELFEKYGFALFYKNVRNPLLESQFNEDIEKTALEEPAFFWYYNNGITAITNSLPAIGKRAEKIELTGLQIINGAQTVYSIYRAYKNASPVQRKKMDSESLITLRLLNSGGKIFDLNVTRYTNSQNPVDDRDFCANDDIQIRLQNEFYQTNIWYEKRRDEFREKIDGIEIVSNTEFAIAYLGYHLQDIKGIYKYISYLEENKELIFISDKENKDGLYEKIFNEDTLFEDMLCSLYVYKKISTILEDNLRIIESGNNPMFTSIFKDSFNRKFFFLLVSFKLILTKYLKAKFGDEINVNSHIVRKYEELDSIFKRIFDFINDIFKEKTVNDSLSIMKYEEVRKFLVDLDISVKDIENS